MHPLLFVNWSSVNKIFRGLIWLCVIAIVTVIVVHLIPASAPAQHAMHVLR